MPTTTGKATDLITFSRGTLATVTDADGKIKWAPHNLLTNSEQFDASAWSKTSITLTANAVAAPNGTTTADTLTASGANGTALQSYTAIAVPYTFGVWLKRKTGTGTIEIAADNGTYTAVTITSDWALYTVTQTPAAGSKSAGIRLVTSGDAVEAWGAHLYRSDLGGMQANASAYPMYNPSTPKNLLGYSEDFSNAAWGKVNILAFGSGSISNAAVAPNGSQSADLVVPNATSGTHVLQQGPTVVNGTPYVNSLYVKPAGYTKIAIRDNAAFNRYVSFSLSGAGAVLANGSSATGSIVALNDGWYRIQMSATAGATTNSLTYYFLDNAYTTGDPLSYSYAGDGTSGLYLWGAQLSDSASLDAYSPVFGAAPSAAAYHGPRLDYDPVTLSARGLLVEEARTNLFVDSNGFNYNLTNITVGSGIVSPTGATDGVSLSITANTSALLFRAVNVDASTTYTASLWIKGTGASIGKTARLWVWYAGTATGPTSQTDYVLTGSWQRISVTTTPTGSGQAYVRLDPEGLSGAVSGHVVHVFGSQFEVGAFPTSYIPTAAATVTRNADVASVGVSQFPYSATEGTLVAYGSWNGSNDNYAVFSSFYVDVNNHLTLDANNTARSAQLNNRVAGTFTVNISGLNTGSSGVPFKAGAAYKENDFAAVVNGGTVGTDTTGTPVSGVSVLYLGARGGNAQFLSGHIRQITYLPRRLTNAELQSRTA